MDAAEQLVCSDNIGILAGQSSLSANESRQSMGPVILLQNNHPNSTSLKPVFTSWTIQKTAPTKGVYVNAASQEDDSFVFITIVYAVISSWEMEPN
ncbi:hypothetical protein F5B19DRAFT_442526 [Rostrohypoxylon terebratum]|nr:hypothetical protein F5B19DRAFT_442526 [Rostrohypoxylon terebratum]